MTSIEAFCARAKVPLPWRLAWASGPSGAHHTVVAADGVDLNYRVYETEEDARIMTALGAFAPTAMAYVEKAAAKGGVEAQAIVEAFRTACATPVLERSR